MNNNDDYSVLDIAESAVEEAGVDFMSKTLASAQISNPVKPSIPSIPNNVLNTSVETATHECDDLSTNTCKDDNIVYSNAEFDLNDGGLTDFMDSTEKDDTVNCTNTAILNHTKENNAAAHHAKENELHTTKLLNMHS